MGDFHELAGDLTREQLNSDPTSVAFASERRLANVTRVPGPKSWPAVLTFTRGRVGESFLAARVWGIVVLREMACSFTGVILARSTFLSMPLLIAR